MRILEKTKQIQSYRRENGLLKLQVKLFASDIITSPLLPEFSCSIAYIYFSMIERFIRLAPESL